MYKAAPPETLSSAANEAEATSEPAKAVKPIFFK
jgi:hypothetical protein